MNKLIAARPNLGGWLTIFNIVTVLGMVLTGEHFPRLVVYGVIAFLSLPISWIIILPYQQPTFPIVIVECLSIGLNAFLWGYGMAWLIRFMTPLRLRSPATDNSTVERKRDA